MPPSMQSYPRYISGLSHHPADASMTTSWCWQDLVSFVMPQPATTSRGGTIRPAPLANLAMLPRPTTELLGPA